MVEIEESGSMPPIKTEILQLARRLERMGSQDVRVVQTDMGDGIDFHPQSTLGWEKAMSSAIYVDQHLPNYDGVVRWPSVRVTSDEEIESYINTANDVLDMLDLDDRFKDIRMGDFTYYQEADIILPHLIIKEDDGELPPVSSYGDLVKMSIEKWEEIHFKYNVVEVDWDV